MERKLFGTDGIRGVAGEYPLDPQTAFALGRVLGRYLERSSKGSSVVIGIDTRESGPWLARVVAAGLASAEAEVSFAGVITTPGLAWVTRQMGFAAGVMISASHNPYQDNGIKIIDRSGFKLADQEEQALEAELRECPGGLHGEAELVEDRSFREAYLDWLRSTIVGGLKGWKLAIDCANGAASELGPRLLRELGAEVVAVADRPDGRNINDGCGSLHPELVRAAVAEHGARAGLSLDGDGDRCVLVSSKGTLVDGDGILLVSARYLLARGELTGPEGQPAVVATVMSNLGLEKALRASGIRLFRTAVGDRYVLEEMLRRGIVLGGEQSGHIIYLRCATTGDGLLTGLKMLQIMKDTGRDLDELVGDLRPYPQLLINVKVRERKPLEELVEVREAIQRAEQELGGEGRVLVRYSGTELVARVMVEGPEEHRVAEHARRIAEALRVELGA